MDSRITVNGEMIRDGIMKKIGLVNYSVLIALASFIDDQGECSPTQDELAEITGLSRRSINRIISELSGYRTPEGKRLLLKKTDTRNGKRATFYTIIDSHSGIDGYNIEEYAMNDVPVRHTRHNEQEPREDTDNMNLDLGLEWPSGD